MSLVEKARLFFHAQLGELGGEAAAGFIALTILVYVAKLLYFYVLLFFGKITMKNMRDGSWWPFKKNGPL
jgi:hypothetical protein